MGVPAGELLYLCTFYFTCGELKVEALNLKGNMWYLTYTVLCYLLFIDVWRLKHRIDFLLTGEYLQHDLRACIRRITRKATSGQ